MLYFGDLANLSFLMYQVMKTYEKRNKNTLEYYISKISYKRDVAEQNLITLETFEKRLNDFGFVEADCKMFSILRNCIVKGMFLFVGKNGREVNHVCVIKNNVVYDDTNKICFNFQDYLKLYPFVVFS